MNKYKKLVILSDTKDSDPLVVQLMDCADNAGVPLQVLSPKNIIDGTAKSVLKSDDYYIMNRLSDEVKQEYVSQFRTSRSTAMEYRLTIEDFLSDIEMCSSKPGLYSLVGNKFPLNLQWKIVLENFESLDTPDFYYVFGREEQKFTEEMKKKGYIKMDPNIIYDWTDNTLENQWHPFYVKKPSGQPYIYSFIKDDSLLLNIDGSDADDVNSFEHLNDILPEIRSSFGAFSGEILLFKDDDKLVYGGLSHSHISSSRSASYRAFVQSWLEQSFLVNTA